jgi:hypothetical protein
MQNIKIFHIIRVRYHGATNTKGSRVSLYSERFNERVFIPFDYSERDIESMAINYLIERGYKVAGYAEGYVMIDTFKSIKKLVPCKHDAHYIAGFECNICHTESFEPINDRV